MIKKNQKRIKILIMTIIMSGLFFFSYLNNLSAYKLSDDFNSLTRKEKIIEIRSLILKLIERINEILIEMQKGKQDNRDVLFRSDFENTFLSSSESDEGGVWWQKIKGENWPIKINDSDDNGILQMIVDYDKKIDKYIVNRIENVKDKNGKYTKALHQIIKKKQVEDTQDPYIIYTKGKEVKDMYIKYTLKYSKDFVKNIGKDGWAVLTEFKTISDYRLALYVYRDSNEDLYWYAHGDNVVEDDRKYEEYWYRENKKVKVPVDEWFDVEIYWHRSKGNDGRVVWKINSKTVVDYRGSLMKKDPINAIMLFTNYASAPIDQWIDNIEVRKFPPKNFL